MLTEFFWKILLEAMQEGRVVPVVGSDLLRVAGAKTREQPFSQCIAEALALRLKAANPPLKLGELIDVEKKRGRGEDELFYELWRAHGEVQKQIDLPEPLRLLAKITDFSLFLSTTTDSLLERALCEERHLKPTICAANLFRDLPDELAWEPQAPPPKELAIYHFFGRFAPEHTFALHDEDMLEFLVRFQETEHRPINLFDRLQRSHLLLIGNSFPDWQSRFLVRILRGQPLSQLPPASRVALADECTRGRRDAGLVSFLSRFGERIVIFEEGGADEFILELYRRWIYRPSPTPADPTPGGRYIPDDMVENSIFISYAREDETAARTLHNELASRKYDVWFDQRRLKGGDPFEEKIASHIRKCDLFVPIVSRHTNRRSEGFVFREWRLALERQGSIQYGNFIFPVIVDDLADHEIAGVADMFRKMHYHRAKEGALDEGLLESFKQNIREIRSRRQGLTV